MSSLLEQLDRARPALEMGRAEAEAETGEFVRSATKIRDGNPKHPRIRGSVGPALFRPGRPRVSRQRFIDSSQSLSRPIRLFREPVRRLAAIEWKGLILAARSFAHKKAKPPCLGRSARSVCYNQYSNAVD